jgi:hypothetical protein
LTTDYKRTLLLFAIFIVAFLFRVGVIFHNEYPPSSDIGFHSSIINLILDEGKLPLWNPYHMGGEPLATPPGYYLFASFIVLFTGMPLLVGQLLIAAFFSSFAVFPTYLISKKIWRNTSTGLFAAFFVTVSSLSLEMLGWGGYPNVISLTLILIIFYLFLKDRDRPHHFNLFTTALLFGSLTLTHLFSLFVLLPVLILYISLLLVGKALKLLGTDSLKAIRFFFISVALGTLFASPWLLRVSGFYLGMSSEGAFWGGMQENRNLILINRYVDIKILVLIGAVLPTLFMLKASRKRYVDSESLLLIIWYAVPLVLTQAYIFGIFVDYSRFMYFADFPGILILSAALVYLFRYVSIAIKKFSVAKWNRSGKTVSQIALPAILLVIYLISPSLITPTEALTKVDFYTSMKKPEATAMEWIQQRTANSAVLVADHLYGWWLSGVAQRSTLSAAGLEFLLYSHEVEVAKSAQFLLDTDYYIDNGLIQVREDGPYFPRHNPIFSIETTTGYSHPLLHFDDNETTIFFQRKHVRGTVDLSDLNIIEAPMISRSENSIVLTIISENDFLRVEKTLEVHRGVRFVELSYATKTKDEETSIGWVRFILHIREGRMALNQSMMGLYDAYERVCGQIIFKDHYPEVKVYTIERMSGVEFLYTAEEDSSIRINFLVGVFDVENMKYEEILETYDKLSRNPQQIVANLPIIVWDYREVIKSYNISFIVCRDQEIYPKFSNDPNFQVVYNSVEVAIFKVVGTQIT